MRPAVFAFLLFLASTGAAFSAAGEEASLRPEARPQATAPEQPSSRPEAALLNKACEDYEKALSLKGDARNALLRSAIQGFEQARRLLPGLRPWLEYDLGTACLAAEEFGKSIFHLKLALMLEPGDPRIRRNLARACKIAQVEPEPAQGGGLRDIAVSYWSRSTPFAWCAALVAVSWILAALEFFTFRRRSLSRALACATLILALFGAAWARENGFGVEQEVVLLCPYNPRTGLGENYPTALQEELRAGASGILLREEKDLGWREVKWKASAGWVPAAMSGLLSPR